MSLSKFPGQSVFFDRIIQIIKKKILTAWQNKLTTILCVGENLDIAKKSITNEYILQQLKGIPIGGTMSSAILEAVLSFLEHTPSLLIKIVGLCMNVFSSYLFKVCVLSGPTETILIGVSNCCSK